MLPRLINFPATAVLVLLLYVSSSPTIVAFPFGAGGCTGGQAAVGPPHRFDTNVTTGTLAVGGFSVLLDSKVLKPGVPASFDFATSHKIEIKALSKSTYLRGFLIRFAGGTSAAPTFEALSPFKADTDAQYAIFCVEQLVGGVTHTSSSKKTSASANLTLPVVASGLPLEITVVVENDEGVSTFYYTEYVVNSINPSSRHRAPKGTKGKGTNDIFRPKGKGSS